MLQGITQLAADRTDAFDVEHAAFSAVFEAEYFNLMEDGGERQIYVLTACQVLTVAAQQAQGGRAGDSVSS